MASSSAKSSTDKESKSEAPAAAKPAAKAGTKTKTTRSGKTRTVSSSKPAPEQRQKRAAAVAAKTTQRKSQTSKSHATEEKGLVDLLEHALRDMYYAERKIYRALPKMIKAADDEDLAAALTSHRDETQSHIEALEDCFEAMGLRAKAEKCDAIDGILEEAAGILEDFGGTLAGDAAIIFSARAVEHYEIVRYDAMVGFAHALGLDEVHSKLSAVLEQEKAAEAAMTALAEGSINEAASEYDAEGDDDDMKADNSKMADEKANKDKASKSSAADDKKSAKEPEAKKPNGKK